MRAEPNLLFQNEPNSGNNRDPQGGRVEDRFGHPEGGISETHEVADRAGDMIHQMSRFAGYAALLVGYCAVGRMMLVG